MKLWVAFKNIGRRNLLMFRRYLFNTISMVVTLYIVFIMLFFGGRAIGSTVFQSASNLEAMIVGYVVWSMALSAYSEMSWDLVNEAQMGTLEQLYLSPLGYPWVAVCSLIANFAFSLVTSAILLVLAMVTTGHYLRLDVISVLPLLIVTIAAAYGIGFVTGGFALIFKRVQAFFQILQFVFLAFMLAPAAPFWSRLLPLNLGNRLLIQVMVQGKHLWTLSGSDLLQALIINALYLATGILAYRLAERAAKDRGLLGHY